MSPQRTTQELFSEAEGKQFTIEFLNGDIRDLLIVSASHVFLDDSVIGVPLNAEGAVSAFEPGLQFNLKDVQRVFDHATHCLLLNNPG